MASRATSQVSAESDTAFIIRWRLLAECEIIMAHTQVERQEPNFSNASKAELIAEINRMQRKVADAEKRATDAEKQNNSLATKLQWYMDKCADQAAEIHFVLSIIRNKAIQGNQKSILIGAKYAEEAARAKGAKEKDGMVRVYREDFAEFAGVSPETISGSATKKLVESGLLNRSMEGGKGKDGFTKEVFLALPEQVKQNPSGVELSEDLRIGGNKIPLCPACKSQEVERKVTFTCKCCGVVTAEKDMLMIDEELLLQEAEMIDNADKAEPTSPAPMRDCLACSDALEKPYRNWIWDYDEQRWMCGNEGMHTVYRQGMPKINQERCAQ